METIFNFINPDKPETILKQQKIEDFSNFHVGDVIRWWETNSDFGGKPTFYKVEKIDHDICRDWCNPNLPFLIKTSIYLLPVKSND